MTNQEPQPERRAVGASKTCRQSGRQWLLFLSLLASVPSSRALDSLARPQEDRSKQSMIIASVATDESSIPENIPTNHPSAPRAPAPAVDLRPRFQQWGLAARKQGSRPTCSVFTLTGGLEYALACRRGRGERLSVEYLNWAANQVRSNAGDGGFFSDLWNGFAAHGICAESQMVYKVEFSPAASPSPAAVAEADTLRTLGLDLHWIKKWNVRTGLTDSQLAAIKQTLNEGWPVCAGCRWPKEEKWDNNVLQMCAPEDVRDGHSVLLVGYRDDAGQAGGGIFIFRNSNGGHDGCMPYAYAISYVNDAAWISAPEQ